MTMYPHPGLRCLQESFVWANSRMSIVDTNTWTVVHRSSFVVRPSFVRPFVGHYDEAANAAANERTNERTNERE